MTNLNATGTDDLSEQCNINTLYDLLPVCVGTALVESLTSYVARLAEAHCVSTGSLISQVIIPQLAKPYLTTLATSGGTRLYDRSHALNGVGEMAESWGNVLQALTGRLDLTRLTWGVWRTQIPSRELLKQVRCWCSVCFDEQADKGEPVYEPLLWTFKRITSCAVHGVELITSCPHCGKQTPVLERKTSPGRCSKCNSWLGGQPVSRGDTSEVQLVYNQQIGQVLAVPPDPHRVYKSISETLNTAVNRLHDGNLAATARYLQVPKTTFWGWTSGRNLPTLEQAIYISLRFDIDLVDLLQGNTDCKAVSQREVKEIRPSHHHRPKQRVLDLTSLKHELQAFQDLEPRSLRTIANTVGVSERTLRKHFPDKCENISERMRSSVNVGSQSRKHALAESIRQATIMLHELAIYPSRRKVEAFLNSPGVLREHSAKTAWHDTLCDIGLRFDRESYRIDKTSN